MQSQEVLALLSSRGIDIHRETLARTSDELGLRTRTPGAQGLPRTWSSEQVEQLIGHLHANGWKQMVPASRRPLTHSDGPFRTRDVLAFLEARGHRLHRETLARISDSLGLLTRREEAATIQRSWSREQAEEIANFLTEREERKRKERLDAARRALAHVEAQDLHTLLESDPSLADAVRAASSPSGPAAPSDGGAQSERPESEEAA